LLAAGCRAEWVGHPSFEGVCSDAKRHALRAEFEAGETQPLIALLPGSRHSEIRVLAPRLARTAELLRAGRSMRFVAVVPKQMKQEARSYFPEWIPVLADRAGDLLLACDAAIVKTGTATLEAVLAGAPQVAVYDATPIGRMEWCLLWAWKRIPYIAMPNIILQRMAVPELLGLNCQPEKIARAVSSLLDDDTLRSRMLGDYSEICRALGSGLAMSATERTAEVLEEMIGGVRHPVPTQAYI
jgi:lipid-A-disaccharide synthase